MSADQRPRLRRRDVGGTNHQHDRGRERNDGERRVRRLGGPLHGGDGEGASKARDGALDHLTATYASRRVPRRIPPTRAHPFTTKEVGGRSLCRPRPQISRTIAYFRLVIAVRSAESLTMPAAPHQFDPAPVGLIEVMLVVPVALNALVK